MNKLRTALKWPLIMRTFYPILFVLIFAVLGLASPRIAFIINRSEILS
jgi:hypothetical protein